MMHDDGCVALLHPPVYSTCFNHVSTPKLWPADNLTFCSVMSADQSINFGQIIAIAAIGYLLYRWLSSSSHGASGRQQALDPAHVDQVAQMFPQLDRRAIMWDLQRNGGSVQATTERVLSGRTLDNVSVEGNTQARLSD